MLRASHLARVDLTQPLEQLERDLTRKHFVEIQVLFASETTATLRSFPIMSFPRWSRGVRRRRSRPPTTSRLSRQQIRAGRGPWKPRSCRQPGRLGEYLKDVNDKFVGGVAAPLVGEGAMIAYLLTNETTTVFREPGESPQPTVGSCFGIRRPAPSHHLATCERRSQICVCITC